MEWLSSDLISTGQQPPLSLQSRPIRRTGSGRPTNKRVARRFAPSPTTTPLQQYLDAPDEDGETNSFLSSKEWQAIQCLKNCFDRDVLRLLDYARYLDHNPTTPQYPQPRDSLNSSINTRSSSFSAVSSRTSYTRRSLNSFHDDHQPPVPALEGRLSNDVEEYRHSILNRDAAMQEKLSLPSPRYFCTFCEKDFGRKGDWKSHEKEFHERQEEYACPSCDDKFYLKHRFIRHHSKGHGCVDCPHAETCRTILPKKRAWGCGFCGQSLPTLSNRFKHIAEHYEDGMKRSQWNHSWVILGLLTQPYVLDSWSLVLVDKGVCDWSTCSWSKETTSELQNELELEGPKTGATLAMDAYNLMKTVATGTGAITAPMPWTRRPDLEMMAAAPKIDSVGGFCPELNSLPNMDVASLSPDRGQSTFSGYQPDLYTSGQGHFLPGNLDGALSLVDYASHERSFFMDDDEDVG